MLSETLESWTAQWKREGRIEGEAGLLHRQLRRRFDPLPDWVEGKLAQATEQDLERWAESVLDATSLQQVFAR